MERLKKLINSQGVSGYIIPKNDEYFNEYTDNSKDRLKFISNFSGSAGFAVILKNKKIHICRWEIYNPSKKTNS